MANIVPAILETDKPAFLYKLSSLPQDIAVVHLDVIDRTYGVLPTLTPKDWSGISFGGKIIAHLMVSKPLQWVDDALKAGSTTIIAQIEDTDNQNEFIETVGAKGGQAGLAINLSTPIENLEEAAAIKAGIILLMAIPAGKAGQQFNPAVLDKIRQVRQYCGKNAVIAVDGGITLETAQQSLDAGANVLVVNSYIWQDFPTNLRKLQAL